MSEKSILEIMEELRLELGLYLDDDKGWKRFLITYMITLMK